MIKQKNNAEVTVDYIMNNMKYRSWSECKGEEMRNSDLRDHK